MSAIAQPEQETLPSNRSELAAMFTGEGVELGVASGNYSALILERSNCTRLWSIDRWSDHHDAGEYIKASRRLVERGRGRCVPLRMTFTEALPLFKDDSLGFAYIDGYAHAGQEGGKTLEDWWPKLKAGGIFAGHDYHPRWRPTMDAVDAFAARHGLTLHVASEGTDTFPSWWIRKPPHAPTSLNAEKPLKIAPDARVILVGNGPAALNCNGVEIDRFDEVVRFNEFRTEGFEAKVGTKTTLWSNFGRGMLPGDATRPDRVLCIHEKSAPTYEPRELYRIPAPFYNETRRQVQQRARWMSGFQKEVEPLLCTSGLLVAAYLLQVVGVKKLTLAGFDHFSKAHSKLHHYWVPKAYGKPKEHDGAVEAAMFAELRACGLIEYLPLSS